MKNSHPNVESGPIRLMVLGFAVAVIVTLVAAALSINRIENELSNVGDQQADAYTVLLRMDGIVNDAVQELFAYLVSGEEIELDEYRVGARNFNSEAIHFSSLARLAEPSQNREFHLLDEVQEDWAQSFGQAEAMVREYEENQLVTSETFHSFESSVDSVTNALDELLELQHAKEVAARKVRDEIIHDSEKLLLATALASIAAILTIGIFLTKRVSRHIDAIEGQREALSMLEVAMNSASSGFCFAAPEDDWQLTYVNDAMTEITGYTRDELLGKNCRILQGEATDQGDIRSLREALAKGQPQSVTIRNYRKNGEPFWNELFIAPVRDDAGRLTHFVGVSNDVSERIEVEARFQRAQKLDAVGQLAGGLAHDFNNYLTIINANAELISETAPDDPRANLARQIQKAGERSAELTRQLLAFSRRQVLTPEVLDLNRVVLDMDPLLRRTLGDNIELETITGGGLGMVTADRARIEQVLLNLVVNARDAQPDGGQITIETANVYLDAEYAERAIETQEGRHVMIAVSDAGQGISPEIEDRIFDPFFTTKEVGNSGLGLSTVLGIVEQSGGFIRAYSERDSGTTFKVYLPRVSGEPSKSQVLPSTVLERFGGRALVVDDQPMVLRVAANMLEGLGFEVESANCAEDALSRFKEGGETFTLLLTDVMLPGMGGRELAEIVQEESPSTRVLFMSGYTENGIIHHGRLDDGIELLQKPFTRNDMARKLTSLLGVDAGPPTAS